MPNKGRKAGSGRMSRAAVLRHMATRQQQAEHQPTAPQALPVQTPTPTPMPRFGAMPGAMPASQDPRGAREKAEKTLARQEYRNRRDRKMLGLSAGPVDSEYTSRTKRPLAPDQVRALGRKDTGRIDPFSVYTLQDTASSRFANEESVMRTATELEGRTARKPDKRGHETLPAIQLVIEGDKVFTRDHRRLAAARRANVAIDYTLTDGKNAMKDAERKRSTKTGGSVLKLTPDEPVRYRPEELFGSDD